jgi:general secretion pathway protein D
MNRIRLAATAVVWGLVWISICLPVTAKTGHTDKALLGAMEAERAGDFDKAYELIQAALSAKPGDLAYQLEASRIRFETAAHHVHHAQQLRDSGKTAEALKEFELAFGIDPSSGLAAQEVRRTKQMLQEPASEGTLTPVQKQRKDEAARIDSIQPIPELRAFSSSPINLTMTNRPKVLFDTLGRLAGVNVIFDPDYETANTIKQQTIELTNATLQQALDYLALLTRSYWKPLSTNTLFVTVDNRQKRQDYEEQAVRVFYLTNITQVNELNEIVGLLRTVTDTQKIFISTPMNAIVVRAEPDKIRLAEKLIAAVDKPKGEVIVDVMVMEVNRTYMRNLSAAFGASGINSSVVFTPRASITGQNQDSGTNNSTVTLANVKRIFTGDFTVSGVPGALIEALLSDSGTRVLQAPQIRALDNFKSSLKVGSKVPTASGSYSAGTGATNVNALVNTQFTYLDVGVNVDMTPRVHDAHEVSMHLSIEVSQVADKVNIGGVDEPEIGQRKFELDLRMRDGEINLIGGLMKEEEDKTVSGIPGLGQVPFLKRLFSSENITRTQNELLITLVPHIIRSTDITPSDLREAATGNSANIKLTLAPK